jgi:hypothetical protein
VTFNFKIVCLPAAVAAANNPLTVISLDNLYLVFFHPPNVSLARSSSSNATSREPTSIETEDKTNE